MTAVDPVVIYTPQYDLHLMGLEKLHPFDGRKFSRAWLTAYKSIGSRLKQRTFQPPRPAECDELLTVHSEAYLNKLNSPRYVAEVIELPLLASLPMFVLERRILRPMRLATMGTVMAARTALRDGVAINLGGGYHHASREKGEGFCFYADINIAIETLRRSGELVAGRDRVMIIDLDVHQGNGHERASVDDDDIFIFDMYNRDIYPGDEEARRRIDYEAPLTSGADDTRYLQQLRKHLPAALAAARLPRLAFYIAGTDVYEHDRLGALSVSQEGILERDKFVFKTLVNAGVRVAMLTGGGYSGESYRHIARTVEAVFETWGAGN
jgi:histone deacetylase 11